MPIITVRNVPDSVYQDLKEEARQENRSLNGQALHIFQSYMKQRKPTEDILNEISALHNRVGHSINFCPEEVKAMIEEGRP